MNTAWIVLAIFGGLAALGIAVSLGRKLGYSRIAEEYEDELDALRAEFRLSERERNRLLLELTQSHTELVESAARAGYMPPKPDEARRLLERALRVCESEGICPGE